MLRQDLNGLRLQVPGIDTIYLVDEGKIRGIPSPEVYNHLFRDWNGIVQDIDVNEIDAGEKIPDTAILFKVEDLDTVYLLDGIAPNQIKRGIVSVEVFDQYNFSWDQVFKNTWNVPISALKYPDGHPIAGPD
jgi:hypothetical protein